MVGASKGYEQVVASCCLRTCKRLAGSPPEGPKKNSFPKRIFSEHIEGFPLHFLKFLEPPAIILRNLKNFLTHSFAEFWEYQWPHNFYNRGEVKYFFSKKNLEYFQIINNHLALVITQPGLF
jgi:hypothetical protein